MDLVTKIRGGLPTVTVTGQHEWIERGGVALLHTHTLTDGLYPLR
jgi:hypothetical protein